MLCIRFLNSFFDYNKSIKKRGDEPKMNTTHLARLEEYSRHNEKVNRNQWKNAKRKSTDWLRKM